MFQTKIENYVLAIITDKYTKNNPELILAVAELLKATKDYVSDNGVSEEAKSIAENALSIANGAMQEALSKG